MTVLVELQSVSKYFNNKILIEDVSFKLNKGEITTLIGQNGAGKTTLAKILLGQESYSSGQRIIQPHIKIGYVPQKLNLGYNMPITAEGLLNILSPEGLNPKLFNFEEFIEYNKIKDSKITTLSGGELQKLLLVGTLMDRPDLLILDEPTQFLDVNSQHKFYQILRNLKKKLNLTIFMISHDLFTVMKNSDQVICLNKHICCSGKANEIKSNKDFQNALSEIGVYIHDHDHKH